MTWSLNSFCYNCALDGKCADKHKIAEGINQAHLSGEEHKGSGSIIIYCINYQNKWAKPQP